MSKCFRSRIRLIVLASLGVVLLQLALFPVYATQPWIYADPVDIPINGITDIHLRTQSGGPSDFQRYIVHEIAVWTPANDQYMLGNATRPLTMYVPGSPNGLDIRVLAGDDKVVPFGTGVSMPITIDGKDYYWFRTKKAGQPVQGFNRLDFAPTPDPTGVMGTYEADVEGWSVYGPTPTLVRLNAWFDVRVHFTVPEIGLSLPLVTALGFALFLIKSRQKNLTKA